MSGARTFMTEDLGCTPRAHAQSPQGFLSWLCSADEVGDEGRWLDTRGGRWHQICQRRIKDAACLYSHSSHLHPGEMEREVPALIRSVQAGDHSLLTCTYRKGMENSILGMFFLGDFFFFNVMFFSHPSTELHMWLCLTKVNFSALIYHVPAPPETSG